MKRRTLPVLLERDFRKMAATDGATVEIECVGAPDPEGRFSGEWLFYVVGADGERFMLVTALARERVCRVSAHLWRLQAGARRDAAARNDSVVIGSAEYSAGKMRTWHRPAARHRRGHSRGSDNG